MTDRLTFVIFDCDGTLVDSQHVIVAAMTEAWRAHGLPDPSPRDVRRVVGLPLVTAVEMLLPDGREDPERVAESYKQAFFALRQRPDHIEPLFPGIESVLDRLSEAGVILGVATGKSRRGLVATLDRHGLASSFTTLKTADDGAGKPAPDMVLQAMADVGAEPEDTVVVGDTVFDMQMAINAGVPAIGVAWGYHEVEELHAAGARSVVHDMARLIPEIADTFGTVL